MRKPTSMKTILNPKPATVKKAKKKATKPSPMPMMDSPKRVSDHMAGKSMVAKSHTGMTKHLKGMME